MTSTAKNNGKNWTPKSINYMLTKLDNGWSYSSVGKVLGRTSEAVRKKASRV